MSKKEKDPAIGTVLRVEWKSWDKRIVICVAMLFHPFAIEMVPFIATTMKIHLNRVMKIGRMENLLWND